MFFHIIQIHAAAASAASYLSELLKKIRSNDPTLTTLDLSYNNIGDEGAKVIADALKGNKTLTTLDLSHNNIEVEGTKALAEALKDNKTLTTLNLSHNEIGDEGAKAIAEALRINTTLTTLNLRISKIGDKGAKDIAEALKENQTLISMDLKSNNIGDEGAKALADALRINTTLTTLNLFSTGVGAEGAKAIAEALKANETLTTLDLVENHIGAEGAKAIADALKGNKTLTTLDLSGSNIGYSGAKAIAEALKANKTLTTLDLSSNSIISSEAIADALRSNTTLTTLNFSFNSIEAEGAKAIAEALKHNKTLVAMNLKSNNIKVEGAKAIAEALKDNQTLTTLDLSYNNIEDEGARSIADALRNNTTLTTLNLSSNKIGAEGAKAITEVLERNETILTLNGVEDSKIAPLLKRNKRKRLEPLKLFLSKYGDLPYKIKGLTSLYLGLSKEERETVEKEIAKQREGASAEQERLKAIYEQQPQRVKTQFPLLDRWRKAQKALYDNAIAQKQTTATFREWLYQTFPLENQTYNLYIYERQRDNQRHNYTNSQLLFEDWFTHKQEPLRAIYEQQSDELKQQTPFDMWLQNQRESYDEATHEGPSHTAPSSLSFEEWLSQHFPTEKQQYDFYLDEMSTHKGTKTSFIGWFDHLHTIYNRQSEEDKRQISFEDWAKIMRVSYEEAKQTALQTTSTTTAAAASATTITEFPLLADWLEAQYAKYQTVMAAAAKPHPSFADWLKSNAHS